MLCCSSLQGASCSQDELVIWCHAALTGCRHCRIAVYVAAVQKVSAQLHAHGLVAHQLQSYDQTRCAQRLQWVACLR